MGRNKSRRRRKKEAVQVLEPELQGVDDNRPSGEGLVKSIETDPEGTVARLALADNHLRNNSEAGIVETLEPLQSRYPFDDDAHRRLYNRLLAFGYAHLGQLEKAETICHRGRQEEPDGLDYHFILCFMHLSLREYDKAVEYGQRYLTLRKEGSAGGKKLLDYSAAESHLSQAHNFIGSAYYEQAKWDMATEHFELSRHSDPGNHLPYINLANIARHRKDLVAARRTIRDGLSRCRQVQELRLVANSLQDSATISACMIVKDEEDLLPECLESIRDWVDEIILVDTGSSDRTVEIARSYGARIFHQPWEGNFSKHRNYSLEQAGGDWVFIIDADERFVVEDVPQIRRLLNQDDVDIISINVYNVYGRNEELTTFLPSVRFWRRRVNLHYEGIVHNLLKLGEEHPVVRSGVRIKHLGYGLSPEKMRQKFDRSKALLEQQLDEDPNNFFALFNYAQLLKGEGVDIAYKNIPAVIESASRAVELTDPSNKAERHIHLMCLDQLAWANFFKGEYQTALQYIERAVELKPNYLDPLMLKGNVYARQEDWENARVAYQNYLDVQQSYDESLETDCLILTHINNRACAYYGLALIAEIRNDRDQAAEYLERTLSEQPTYLEANLRLGQIYLERGQLELARKHFDRQLALVSGKTEAALALATVSEREKDFEQAQKYFNVAIESQGADRVSRLKYGQFLLNQGRESEAAEQFEKAVESGEGSREVKMQLADVYFNAGRYGDARTIYKQLIDTYGVNSCILNNLGNCHFRSGEFEQAEQYYQQAVDCGDAPDLTLRNLGLTKVRLEKYSEAISALTRCLARAQGEPEISRLVADLYSKTGDFEAALRYYEEFLTRQPTDTAALYNLSECYLNMGHRDSAMLGYRRVLEIDPDFEPARQRLQGLIQPVLNA